MKSCELCKALARTYCESDQASLCWNCDAKVHGANFLVARHSRSLLCHACQAPTPWKASGVKLGHTVSVCESCVARNERKGEEEESEEDNNDDNLDQIDDDDDEDEDDDDDENDDDDEDEEEEEEGDNQVVPWSTTPPPPAASSSSSEGEESVTLFSSLKRSRENASDLRNTQDDLSRSYFQRDNRTALTTQEAGDGEATSMDSTRPLKERRTGPVTCSASPSANVGSVRRFNRQDLCDVGKESGAVDVDSSDSSYRPI